MEKPTVIFLGGAEKCGTTSLYKILARSPEISPTISKEPAYFSPKKESYGNYLEDCYKNNYGSIPNNYFLDGSTCYLHEPSTWDRIKQQDKLNKKFIFLLRDPIDRAWSAYFWLWKPGFDKRSPEEVFDVKPGPFEQVKKQEDKKLIETLKSGKVDLGKYEQRYGDPLWIFRYISNGFYKHYLEQLENVFGAENILILRTENLRQNRETVKNKISDFLDLDVYSLNFDVKTRKTTVPKQNVIKNLTIFLKKATKNIVPGKARSKLRKGIIGRFYKKLFYKSKPEVPKNVRTTLEKVYSYSEMNF